MLKLFKSDIKRIAKITGACGKFKPILQNVHIARNGNGHVNAIVTDCQTFVKLKLDTQDCLSPYILPKGLFKNLKADAEFSFNASEESISINSNGMQSKIPASENKEFPAFPEFDRTKAIPLPMGFASAVKKLVKYCADEPARYAIKSFLFDTEGSIVATNGKRLAWAENVGPKLEKAVMVKPSFVKWIENPKAFVQAENYQGIICNERIVAVYETEGQYPPWREVAEPFLNLRNTANFDNAEMVKAIEAVSKFSNEESRGVTFTFSDGKLTLSCQAPELGIGKVEVKQEHTLHYSFSGDCIVAFNPAYILDSLKDTGANSMRFDNADKACFLQGNGMNVITMPINIA